MRLLKNSRGGFTLIESIIVIAVLAAVVFAVYYLAWGTPGKAQERALERDTRTMQTMVGAYLLSSNGLYPTADSKLPEREEYKLIIWEASFTTSRKQFYFYPDFIKELPKHWDEGVWRIDSAGKILVTISPEDY